MMNLAVVSGGLDSCTMLYDFAEQIGAVVNFMYGSKHNEQETKFAEWHAQKLKKSFIRIDITNIGRHLKSDLLLSGGDIPEGHYEDATMKRTVVPFRNGIMLSIAAGIAESLSLKGIMLANHFGDHAIYPDCRGAFIKPMSEAILQGTETGIELFAPYTRLTKADIARKSVVLFDHRLTYSCYKGGDYHCGKCGTCVERKEALGSIDRTRYLA